MRLLALWIGAFLVPSAHALDVSPPVQEVSGAALDGPNSVIWTLGDSGTGAFIGRTELGRGVTELVRIDRAENLDWEALVLGERGDLWILDVGDNDARRPFVTLYSVAAATASILSEIGAERRIEVTYPDGPRDVEAGVIAGDRLYLFEKKRLARARVVSVDLSPGSPSKQRARAEGRTSMIDQITDASVSPEGDLFLLTYMGVFRASWPDRKGRWRTGPERLGFWGQAETLIALGASRFLVAAEEDGLFVER